MIVDALLLNWLPVPEGNLDSLPERLCPSVGCEKCGSVWIECLAVGFRTPKSIDGRLGGVFYERPFAVAPSMPSMLVSIDAVRLQCFDGHSFEFDGVTFREALSLWQMAAIGIGAVVSACYIAPFFVQRSP